MRDVVIVGAARTPIGSFLGALASVPAPKLGATAIKAALERANVSPDSVQRVHMGMVLPAGVGQAPARQAALFAGLPQSVPCVTVNKVCGSGLEAQKNGSFKAEIVPVEIADRKGTIKVEQDEEPGRGNIEKLAGLRPAFQKDGTVTAGNASSINDGAAALVLMSADEAKKRGAKVLAKLVSWGYHAQAPEWFTTAPAGAIQSALERAKRDAKQVDLWEINEAFAVVSLVNNQMLGLDPAKVNIWGGAVALGHPIGASGARVLVTLLHQMAAKNVKTGVASLCIGGGEGIALLVERA